MGWYCDGSIHYGVVWDAGSYSIGYYKVVQGTGSKFLPKTSSMVQFDKNTAPVLQETSEWLPDRFQSRESLYYEKSSMPTGFIGVHQHDRCFFCSVHQYAGGGGGGGKERVEKFFFMWKQLLLFFIDPPSGEGTARPQTQQSLISYAAILCVVKQRFSPLRGDREQLSSRLQTHRAWVEKVIWTIVLVGLGLVTYWNSLCPRLEKWKLCR